MIFDGSSHLGVGLVLARWVCLWREDAWHAVAKNVFCHFILLSQIRHKLSFNSTDIWKGSDQSEVQWQYVALICWAAFIPLVSTSSFFYKVFTKSNYQHFQSFATLYSIPNAKFNTNFLFASTLEASVLTH